MTALEGSSEIAVVLGDEWDEPLLADVEAMLERIGAQPISRHGGLAGTQSWSSVLWKLGDASLLVERETYMGLTLSGPGPLVNAVAAAVLAERKAADPPATQQHRRRRRWRSVFRAALDRISGQ
ncbi:hypothetical protein [Sphingosinicella sp. BN140058]|uniref:hypothetical protein n=1 Tax=Sphingosinicella sp. BN140058 TaxID=1892855 RepID=UPI0010125873|nr:hypothetical protein [Sphingosinicella sp. BN140058]QAY75941.1 hypothetical protein ETR14_04920 [Sphingosinicella sp. BN140058]